MGSLLASKRCLLHASCGAESFPLPRRHTRRGPAKRPVMPDAQCKALPLLGFHSGGRSQTFRECLVDVRVPPPPAERREDSVSVLWDSNNCLVSGKLPRSSEQSSKVSTSGHVHPMPAGAPLSMHATLRQGCGGTREIGAAV